MWDAEAVNYFLFELIVWISSSPLIYPGWRLSGDLYQPSGDCEDSPAGGGRDHHRTSSQRAQRGPWPGLLRPLQGNLSLIEYSCTPCSSKHRLIQLSDSLLCLTRVLKHVSWETSPSQPSISRRTPTSSPSLLTNKAGWELCSFSLLERLQVNSDCDKKQRVLNVLVRNIIFYKGLHKRKCCHSAEPMAANWIIKCQ